MPTDWDYVREVGGDAYAKDSWWLVLSGKQYVGRQGQLRWAGVTGDPRAWSSSPNRLRVSRVGLSFDKSDQYVFIDTKHLLPLPRKLTDDDMLHVELARDFAIRKEFALARAELAQVSGASQAAARLVQFQLEQANKGKKKTKAELDADVDDFLRGEIWPR